MLRVTALRGDVLSLETESRDTGRLLHLKPATEHRGRGGREWPCSLSTWLRQQITGKGGDFLQSLAEARQLKQ